LDILPQGVGLCLDLGAGEGRHRSGIEKAGWRWVGLDIARNDALTVVGDGQCLPLGGESVAAVFANQLLEHVPDPLKTLSEAHRALIPGGHLVASVSFLEPWHDSYFGFSHWGIEEMMCRTGFDLLKVRPGASAFVTMGNALLPGTKVGAALGGALGRLTMAALRWLGGAYVAVRFGKQSEQWKQYQAFLEKAPLRFAGHIMFLAQKPQR
jgi:SAM-dependent methyltransferase